MGKRTSNRISLDWPLYEVVPQPVKKQRTEHSYTQLRNDKRMIAQPQLTSDVGTLSFEDRVGWRKANGPYHIIKSGLLLES